MTINITSGLSGVFYPDNAEELRSTLNKLNNDIKNIDSNIPNPKAIIVPHAAYEYSGKVAANAYKYIKSFKQAIVVGPSHNSHFHDIATINCDEFETILGKIPLNKNLLKNSISAKLARYIPEKFFGEHSIETQLPFLQNINKSFKLSPYIIGEVDVDAVNKLFDYLWEQKDTIFIISANLSHNHNYDSAKKIDSNTDSAIINLYPEQLNSDSSCARVIIQALLYQIQKHNLKIKQLMLKNTGDIIKDHSNVIGFGSYIVF